MMQSKSKPVVLIVIPALRYNTQGFLYLALALQERMTFVFLTEDAASVEECKSHGFDAYTLKTVSPPGWYPFKDMFLYRQGKSLSFLSFGKKGNKKRRHWFARALARVPLFRFLWELYRHYMFRQLAEHIVQIYSPAAIILLRDHDYVYHHLCHVEDTRTVVVHITYERITTTDSQVNRNFERSTINCLYPITRITTRFWKHHVIPHEGTKLLPPSDLWALAGAFAGGYRPGVPRKGGSGATFVCTTGVCFAKAFEQAGVPSEKLVVTGSPDNDRLFQFALSFDGEKDSATLKMKLGIPVRNTQIVSFFLGLYDRFGQNNYVEEVKIIAQALANIASDVFVVLKTHPLANIDAYVSLQTCERIVLVDSKLHSGEEFNNLLICASSLVLLRHSTVSFNVLALDVPLLTYKFPEHPPIHTTIMDGVYCASSYEDLLQKAQNLLTDRAQQTAFIQQQKLFRDKYMILDGKCCERVATVLTPGFDSAVLSQTQQ